MRSQPSVSSEPLREMAFAEVRRADTPDTHSHGGRALVLAGFASLAWGAAAAATILLLARHRPLDLIDLAALSAGVAAPLAAIWLAALTFARVAPGQARVSLARIEQAEARMSAASLRARGELESIDRVLIEVVARVDGLRASVATRASELGGALGQLESRSASISAGLAQDRDSTERSMARIAERGGETHANLVKLIEALPAAETRAQAIGAALAGGASDARGQVEDTDTLLSALWARNEAARHMAAAEAAKLETSMGALDAASERVAAALDGRAAALEGSVERALSRTEGALDASRAGVEAQAAALAAGIEQARTVLGRLGAEADQVLTARLGTLAAEAERLAAALAEQQVQSHGLLDIAERGFGVLDARLAHAAQTTGATLERVSVGIAAARAQTDALIVPLAGAREAAERAEAAALTFGNAVMQTSAAANAALPEVTARTAAASAELVSLQGELDAVRTRAAEVVSLSPLEAARHALATTVDEIGGKLDAARVMASEVEATATAAAATAATRLVEALARVHEVSAQAEGAMRRTLESVVSEARGALSEAGGAAVRQSFAGPIEVELGKVAAAAEASADAARVASERLSRQLMSLVELAGTVEGRIADADARLDLASQGDLGHRASTLIESLNSHAIDIAKALSNEVPDTAWAAYLRGDRGIFTRRAVRLLDRGAARSVARRFEVDGEFRDQVRRYIHDFEALLRRAAPERDGGQLSVALVSSDVGRLYVALAQSIERLRDQ